jgi:phospholipid/cholesterol/gamma-HCH transport system substrate-binding protein
MTPKTSYVLVGLFVLMLGAALIATILWLTTGGPPKDYEEYYVFMTESVSGLSVDSPVKYKGVNRGRVRRIELDPKNPELVRLTLLVLEDTPVNVDTVATLEQQGLTGISAINLGGGSPESAELRPGSDGKKVISSRPSLLVRLDESASELIGSFIETSQRLNDVLSANNRGAIEDLLANLVEVTGNLNRRLNEVDQVIENVNGLVSDLRSSLDGAPALVAAATESAEAFGDTARSYEAVAEQLGQTVESVGNDLAISSREIQHFATSALPEAEALMFELRYASEALRRASEAVERDPRALLFGLPEPPPGPGEKGGSK